MSLSISLRDVASSWGDTGKIVAATAVSVVAMAATKYLMNKACNYFNIPNTMNHDLVQGQLATRRRNHLIMGVSRGAMGLIAPALLSMEFKPFNLSQNIQLAMLDLLVYGVAKAAFRGNTFVESNGFRFLILSRMITGAAFAKMGGFSRLLIPGLIEAATFAHLNNHRERWMGYENVENTPSARFHRISITTFQWLFEPVHVADAPAVGPLPEA